ncbi:MAG TPA: hypothetical protein VII56_19540 [Rhizomicrobium sp.]
MSVDEIEKAITKLSTKDRAQLRARLDEIDAAEFDAKIERDAKSGKIDKLIEQSEADFRAGRYREL